MELKLNYAKVANQRSWLAFILWEFITPGYTALWFLLTSAWYFYRASNADSQDTKKAFNEVAVVFLAWGVFNLLAYGLLVTVQHYSR
jgi:hypothetical protein